MNHLPQQVALVALGCVLLGTSPCCSRFEGPLETPNASVKGSAPVSASQNYKLVGVVKSVNRDTGLVNIRHEEIPGFMRAMTMPFTIKDRETVADLYVGDEVEGTLRVDKENGEVKDYELLDLVVSRPAERPSGSFSAENLTTQAKALQPGETVPDFAMTDQEGRSFTLSSLRGHVVALTFVYTSCPLPNFCPLMDKRFRELADLLSGVPNKAAKVRLLSVSFDPEHDTPEVLAKHAKLRGAKPPLWTYAVASHPELAKVAGPMGLSYAPAKQEIIHNLSMALIDSEGKLISLATGAAGRDWKAVDLVKTIYDHLPD